MEHIQELLSDAGQHVHKTLDVSDETIRRLHDRVMRALPKEQKLPKKWIPATVAAVAVAAAAVVVMPRVIDNMQAQVNHGMGGEQNDQPTTVKSAQLTVPTQLQVQVPNSAIERMSDNEKLTLINPIPWGSPYQDVKQLVPELGEQKPEGGVDSLGQQGLTEAFIPITVYGKQIQLEFNFRNNHMYAIHYNVMSADPQVAAELEKQVMAFYNERYSSSKPEKQTGGGTSQLTNQWDFGTYNVSITNSLNYDKKVNLIWGLELKESEQAQWTSDTQQSDAKDAVLVGVKIGDTPEQVRAALGADYKEQATDGLHSGTTWKYPAIDVFFLKDTNRVMSVTINKPGYKTSLGVTLGDKADTVLAAYRTKYKEFVSPHTKSPITGWFELEPGVLMIFDFDASDGMQANNKLTSDSKVKSIRLASTQAID